MTSLIASELEAQLETSRAQLVSSARLTSLGMMAGGVAHEINNPLSIINGSAMDLLERAKKEGSVPLEIVLRDSKRIHQTVKRITNIVKSLRLLGRDGSQDRFHVAPVARIVDETLEVCKERFKYHSVSLFLPSIDPTLFVSCREAQIAQVLLNLLQNAFDAVGSRRVTSGSGLMWPAGMIELCFPLLTGAARGFRRS